VRTGSITPFFLTISLIVECKPEIHDRVADLLKNLRVFLDARDNRVAQQRTTIQPDARQLSSTSLPLPPPPTQSFPTALPLPAPPAPRAMPADSRPTHRVHELLGELKKEIEKLTPVENSSVGP
jgi:hypothetical protein